MDELRRDIWALHPKAQDMDWLFSSNNPLATDILTVKSFDILPKPSLMRSLGRRVNSRDQCIFHDDMGHKNKDCFTLKDAIEEAIRNGELIEYVNQSSAQQGQSSCGDPKGNQKVRGTIHVIVRTDDEWAVKVKGSITLPVILGDGEHTTIEYIQFYMVNYLMPYNAIFGRPIMRMARMVIAIFYMKIKFSTKTRVGFPRFD
ncbi:hypothetical protein PVK06_004904 [Gossypium arboreum]|uniref:Uncharacterized protein n=1 Tax=Gossypium arboreum TaxID=29729 RepID=A0ABR0QT81_GOSAR|nr:hypothetical protein PVK06_004904 [Gossypium arboreum]